MKKIFLSAITASLFASTLAPTASAAPALPQVNHDPAVVAHKVLTVDEQGNPTSGMVTLDLQEPSSSELSTTAMFSLPGTTTEQVGGGTWNYGWEIVNGTTKHCFSHYNHPDNTHRATATMGSQTDTSTARRASWAKASVSAGLTAGTCNAYWDNR
ncbi:lactococcin 972 family bacteriocin [Corynebacterium sp. SA-MJD20WY100]|uniref:lactococcin 972 family bacteriocin n=1 Tax=Corynebacterium sp. SA-MJD20WY100 TaxID=3142969 RepID=UPI003221F06A